MPEIKIAGPGGTSWSASGGIYMDGIGLPTGRAMANGSQACLITELYGYVAGRGATRTGRLQLGSAATGNFNVGASSSGQATGWYGTNEWLVQGGTTRWGYYFTNAVYFGKEAFAPTTVTDGSTNWSGFALGGHFRYAEGPTAPQGLTAVAHPTTSGAININFSNPASDGGAGLVDFRIYMNGVYKATTYSGSNTITGLTPGTSYSFFVRATNRVTQLAGTEGVSTSTVSAVAPGVPSVPRSVVATPSTSVYGRVALSWTAPTDTAGGITDYRIYGGSTLLGTSTSTSFTASGLAENTTVSFTVAARNSYAISTGAESPRSTAVFADIPGHPRKPENMTGAANPAVAGEILLDWDPPLILSADAPVTRYSVYYSTGVLIGYTTSTAYTVSGLTPGTSYGFYTRAWNAVADNNSDPGPASSTVTVQATGQPDAPTGVSVVSNPLVAGRLALSWVAPAGTITGYNVYRNGVKVASMLSTGRIYASDGLTPGTSYSFYVKARNAITDQTGTDGPASATVSGTPGSTTTQAAVASTVQNATNAVYNGTYTISAQTPTTFSYARTGTNSGTASVTSGFGTVVNNTNTTLNGTYVITSTGLSTFTYARTTGNIAANTATTGTLLNTTNSTFFNGVKTVTASSPTTVSFAAGAGTITNRATGGTISNTTNAVFNGISIPITSVTTDTLSYAKTNANIAESTASGSITNRTNIDAYNGVYTVEDTPLFNTFTYKRINDGSTTGTKTNRVLNPSFEAAGASTVVRTNLFDNPDSVGGAEGASVPGWTGVTRTGGNPVMSGSGTYSTAVATTPGTVVGGRVRLMSTTPVDVTVQARETKAGLFGTQPTIQSSTVSLAAGVSQEIAVGGSVSGVDTDGWRVNMTGPNGVRVLGLQMETGTSAPSAIFSGSTSAAGDFTYAWTGTVNASTSTQTGVLPANTVRGATSVHAIQSSEWATRAGEKSVRLIPTDLGSNNSFVFPSSSGNMVGSVLLTGKTYTAFATVRLTAPQTGTLSTYARSLMYNGTVSGVTGYSAAPNTAGTHQVRLTFSVPSNETSSGLRLYNGAVPLGGEVWWDDLIIIEGDYTGDYFDGNSVDNGLVTYAWTGTANASTSTAASDHAAASILSPYSDVYRNESLASLMVKYRSGWAG